jgi:hypothetical protein
MPVASRPQTMSNAGVRALGSPAEAKSRPVPDVVAVLPADEVRGHLSQLGLFLVLTWCLGRLYASGTDFVVDDACHDMNAIPGNGWSTINLWNAHFRYPGWIFERLERQCGWCG